MNGRTKPSWSALSREEQNLYLKLLWEDAYSELAIARFLGTTKGTIVRRRHGEKIKRDLPVKAGGGQVNIERFYDLLELHKMGSFERENGVVAIAPVSEPYRPVQQASLCEWPAVGKRGQMQPCREPAEPGSKLCKMHKAFAKRGQS